MRYYNKKTEELIRVSAQADQSIRTDESLKAKMLDAGWGEEKIAEGLLLLNELRTSYRLLLEKDDKIQGGKQRLKKIIRPVRTQYTNMLNILKAKFFRNKEKYNLLRLQGKRPYRVLKMAIHAGLRREKIINNADAMAVLAERKITQEILEGIFDKIQEAARIKRELLNYRTDCQELCEKV